MVGVITLGHGSGNREVGGSGGDVRAVGACAAGGCVVRALAATTGTSQDWPRPWSEARRFPAAMISITL